MHQNYVAPNTLSFGTLSEHKTVHILSHDRKKSSGASYWLTHEARDTVVMRKETTRLDWASTADQLPRIYASLATR